MKSYLELTVPPKTSDFELSVYEVLDSIKRRYPHENEAQHKARLKKMYEAQFARVFKQPIYICESVESSDDVDVESTGEN